MIWVQIYDPPSDGVFGLITRDTPAIRHAIERGSVTQITEEEATKLNQDFRNRGEWHSTYLDNFLRIHHHAMERL